MVEKKIVEKLDSVAQELMLIDASDLQALGLLHTEFEQLRDWASDNSYDELASLLKEGVGILGDVMLDNVDDATKSIDRASQIIATVNESITSGKMETKAKSKKQPKKTASKKKKATPPPEQEIENFDFELAGEFIYEANEHLEYSEQNLLILEKNPDDNEAVNTVFRAFHTIKGVAGFLGLIDIKDLAHEAETILDKVRKGDIYCSGEIMDVILASVDAMRQLITSLQDSVSKGQSPLQGIDQTQIITRLQNCSTGAEEAPSSVKEEKPSEPEESMPKVVVEEPESEEVIAVPEDKDKSKPAQLAKQVDRSLAQIQEFMKVDSNRLDGLIDLIGEMVITSSTIAGAPEIKGIKSVNFRKQLRQLEKITRELHEKGMSLRMVPVGPTFRKMERIVRDLAKKAGKDIEFFTHGEDTELDKTVVDRLNDPLLHIVRNAVDHGIESSGEDREKKKKHPKGRVGIHAYHKGGNIVIEVSDDGRGLDTEAILAKALEKGLISGNEQLSDKEIFNLIFEAGFSTAKKITDISGRGVGMDVVRKNIEALNGHVEIDSAYGEGSVFTIKLPLTLAVIDGVITKVGNERYIIPTLSIRESLRPKPEQISTMVNKGTTITLHNHLIPLFRVNELFDVETPPKDLTDSIVVVVDSGFRQIGLVVDELLDQQQIVIKTLEDTMQDVPGISGSTILSDGLVGLIVDVISIAKLADKI